MEPDTGARRKPILGVLGIEQSSTYQAILEEGRQIGLAEARAEAKAAGVRSILLRLGARKFGPPPADVLSTLAEVVDLARLFTLAERVLDVGGWDEWMRGEE